MASYAKYSMFLVLLPVALLAQQRPSVAPYDAKLVESDQEVDAAYGISKGIHQITPLVRGVRGADDVVYWTSSDKQVLLAYQSKQLVWKTNVARVFPMPLQQAGINTLIFASEIAFVRVGKNGFAEVNRKTGLVTSKTIQKN